MGRPREHGTATQAALLAAAAEIVGAEGPAALTVRRAADRVGTTTRAVYSLFGDKDGMLRALNHTAAETMRRHHEAVPVSDDPVSEFPALALAYRDAVLEQPNVYEMWIAGLAAPGPPPYPPDSDAALSYRSHERVLDAIARCVASGRFPGRDVERTGAQLFALVHGLATLELRGLLGDPDTARSSWVDAITAAVTGYQRPPDTDRPGDAAPRPRPARRRAVPTPAR